jgi:hypothetical protein
VPDHRLGATLSFFPTVRWRRSNRDELPSLLPWLSRPTADIEIQLRPPYDSNPGAARYYLGNKNRQRQSVR